MIARTLGLGASLAMAASAFILPSSITIDAVIRPEQLSALAQAPPAPAVDPRSHLLKMDCPGCPFAEGRRFRHIIWSASPVKNALALNFTISDDQSKLLLNGVRVYPPDIDAWPTPITALQFPADGDINRIRAGGCHKRMLRLTGYTWQWDARIGASSAGAEVIPGTLTITSLEGQKINVPAVSVRLVKDNQGRLMLESVSTTAVAEPTTPHPADGAVQCHGPLLLCKLRAIIFRAGLLRAGIKKTCRKMAHRGRVMLMMLRPHHRNQHHHHKQPHRLTEDHTAADIVHIAVPVSHASEGHEPIHAHPHGFGRLLSVVAHGGAVVVLPVLIGIAAGFLVYIVGVGLGMLIGFGWVAARKWRASRRGAYASVDQEENLGLAPDSLDFKDMLKDGFTDEQPADAPPVYYDAADPKELAP